MFSFVIKRLLQAILVMLIVTMIAISVVPIRR